MIPFPWVAGIAVAMITFVVVAYLVLSRWDGSERPPPRGAGPGKPHHGPQHKSRPAWTRFGPGAARAGRRLLGAARRLPGAVRRRFERDLDAYDRTTLALISRMRNEDTGGLIALPPGTTAKIHPGSAERAAAAILRTPPPPPKPAPSPPPPPRPSVTLWAPQPGPAVMTPKVDRPAPETPAAAGSTRPGALSPLPDLPPDDLDASCTYRDEPPLSMWLSDETLARGQLAAIDAARAGA